MTADTCIFCRPGREILAENASGIAVYDKHPVAPGHVLILPRRHATTVYDLSDEEYADCFQLARAVRPLLQQKFNPDGFNIGANCGEAAGQSVWHAHIHVIPRYKGDTPHPKGGVRNVIPLKAKYQETQK
jgi:diadenosine tetraphosphate (Ap4A) HIT family hydrolase